MRRSKTQMTYDVLICSTGETPSVVLYDSYEESSKFCAANAIADCCLLAVCPLSLRGAETSTRYAEILNFVPLHKFVSIDDILYTQILLDASYRRVR